MIEVLVAVLVLAIGLLGLAGMQSFSLAGGLASLRSVQAQTVTQDLIDRIQANSEGNYEVAIPLSAPGTNCLATVCTADQMALYDLWQWSEHLGRYLPNVDIDISRIAATNEYWIAITWDANKSGSYTPPPCTETDHQHEGCLFTAVRL